MNRLLRLPTIFIDLADRHAPADGGQFGPGGRENMLLSGAWKK